MLISRILNATHDIAKTQSEFLTLPARREADGSFTSAWEPTPDELERLNKGAKVYLSVLAAQHPPVKIEVGPVGA